MTNNKQQTAVKLYTEKQVKAMIEKSQYTGLTADFLILAAPSVQLPSDEEIGKKAFDDFCDGQFIDGAKWMRDKIQGGEQ
jgi:hypothetical protein